MQTADFIEPREWQRRAEARLTGMNLHAAKQVLGALYAIWWRAEHYGWTEEWAEKYAARQTKLRTLIA